MIILHGVDSHDVISANSFVLQCILLCDALILRASKRQHSSVSKMIGLPVMCETQVKKCCVELKMLIPLNAAVRR